jgi:heme-degrading protein
MLHKLDNTQYGSITAAEDKAHTALNFRRPSKVFQDLVAQGGIGMRTLGLRGAVPIEGGFPIIVDGKLLEQSGFLVLLEIRMRRSQKRGPMPRLPNEVTCEPGA